jgi:hypothetical protein
MSTHSIDPSSLTPPFSIPLFDSYLFRFPPGEAECPPLTHYVERVAKPSPEEVRGGMRGGGIRGIRGYLPSRASSQSQRATLSVDTMPAIPQRTTSAPVINRVSAPVISPSGFLIGSIVAGCQVVARPGARSTGNGIAVRAQNGCRLSFPALQAKTAVSIAREVV